MSRSSKGGPKAPRLITAHKGGRTARVYIRCTPEIKAKLDQLIETTGKSAGDLLEKWVEQFTHKKA